MNGIATSILPYLLCLTASACQAGSTLAATRAGQPAGHTTPAATATHREAGDPIVAQRIAGDWAFQEACRDGHTITLTLKPKGRSVTGAWDDGTVIRGSSGLLTGRIVGRRVDADLCIDGARTCTPTGFHGDYFVLRGGRLVWMKDTAGRQTAYVTLVRSGSTYASAKAEDCDDEELGNDGTP